MSKLEVGAQAAWKDRQRRTDSCLLGRLCALGRVEFSLPLSLMRRRLHFNMSVFYKYKPCRLEYGKKEMLKTVQSKAPACLPACHDYQERHDSSNRDVLPLPALFNQPSSLAATFCQPWWCQHVPSCNLWQACNSNSRHVAPTCRTFSKFVWRYVCMYVCALAHTNWKGNEKFVKWAYRVFDLTLRF